MAAHKDRVFEDWWPLPRSLDLVRAPVDRVADALGRELARILPDEPCESGWVAFESVDAVFRSVDVMTNVGTVFVALPTRGDWTAVWNNSFLCDGYDSLCHNLTRLEGLDTLHWSSSDSDGPFQAGTTFAYRSARDGGEITRYVQCARNGPRWSFCARGEPLPGEPTDAYTKRNKRERMNEALLARLLERLGAEPWRERSYDLPGARCFRLRRTHPPSSVTARRTADVLGRGALPPEEGPELEGPPSYLRERVRAPAATGPAAALSDRAWCGHREPLAWIHEVVVGGVDRFTVRLPRAGATGGPRAVQVAGADGSPAPFFVYDSRRHPASHDYASSEEPALGAPIACEGCGGTAFGVAVGFEVPSDASSADDTSWFALAVRCARCGAGGLAYEDETA